MQNYTNTKHNKQINIIWFVKTIYAKLTICTGEWYIDQLIQYDGSKQKDKERNDKTYVSVK